MRSGLPIATVVVVGVFAALAFASAGSGASPKTVVITATGPSPSTLSISPYGEVLFVNRDSSAHTVVVRQNAHARWTCSLAAADEPPPGSDQCIYPAAFVSRHSYTVDGQPRGEIVVAGLPRSVSLTARTHTIGLGSRLALHGKTRFESWPEATCDRNFTLLLLARPAHSPRFKRIAIFPVGPTKKNTPAVNNRCSYNWQRTVRPGIATTYVARVLGVARIWRVPTSRPFTVSIRR